MAKYTKNTLQKLLHVFENLQYKVRFEKGNFKSGYCILEERKILVINRFFDIEGKVQTMVDLLGMIEYSIEDLDEQAQKTIKQFLSQEQT